MDVDVDSQLPFAYGTFGGTAPSVCSNNSALGVGEYMNPSIGWSAGNPNGHHVYPPSSGGHGAGNVPFKESSFNPNHPLLSPSYSRKSGLSNQHRAKRGSQIDDMAEESSFLPISKFIVLYLTFLSFALLANIAQMIILFNLLPDGDRKKVVTIYFLFPFLLFCCLKVNDLSLCHQIQRLLDFGYVSTPNHLNRNRQFMHWLTFIGFPFLWVTHSVLHSQWIQSLPIHSKNRTQTLGHLVSADIIDSVLIAAFSTVQFVSALLCIISLLYCVQHNVHQQRPKELSLNRETMKPRAFSFSVTNTFRPSSAKTNGISVNQAFTRKTALLERQVSSLQNELIRCKQDVVAANSHISNDYADELQEKNQEYRALMAERDLINQEMENKKSLLSIKKQQCKQQQATIKSLQQIREENLQIICDLKKKLSSSRKECQTIKVMLQIERQNLQKAQEYFDCS